MIQQHEFGRSADGAPVTLFSLQNASGVAVRLMTRGAAIVGLDAPDRDGRVADVTLGFDTLADYEGDQNPYFGCTVGRYANRIAEGRFTLDGARHELARNNPPNALHGGGPGSFDKANWRAEPTDGDAPRVVFRHSSPDGDEGYPGKVEVEVTYCLTGDGAVRIDYRATTDRPTPLNLTNHAYFNLSGAGAATVNHHVLEINADHYTPVGATLIPTGKLAPVAGSPLDFRQPTPIGDRLGGLVETATSGYDHNFVLNQPSPGELAPAAELYDPASGRVLRVSTTQPGMQFYGGNFLEGQLGKSGERYAQRSACCLETQHFPDSPNQPDFPSTILRPGETYSHACVYAFSVR